MKMNGKNYAISIVLLVIAMFMYFTTYPMGLLTPFFTDGLLIVVYYSINYLMAILLLLWLVNVDNCNIDMGFNFKKFGSKIKSTGICFLVIEILFAICLCINFAPFGANDRIAEVLQKYPMYLITRSLLEILLAYGIIYNVLKNVFSNKKNKVLISGIISSVLFGAFYIIENIHDTHYVIMLAFLCTFGFGLVISYFYEKTHNVVLCALYFFVLRFTREIIKASTAHQFGYNMRYLMSLLVVSLVVIVFGIIKLKGLSNKKISEK